MKIKIPVPTPDQFLAYVSKALWGAWNLRICIGLSLFLQVFLMFFASLRKLHKSNIVHLMIWSAFMLAEWIAIYAIGQTIQSPGDGNLYGSEDGYESSYRDRHRYGYYESLYRARSTGELSVFWAQFLLLHLSGPDNITSFSSVDSGLWLKQSFGLLCQILVTIYSFFLQYFVLDSGQRLWIPTTILFVVGFVKCCERVRALLNASFDQFGEFLLPKPNPGSDYEVAVARYKNVTKGEAPGQLPVEMQPADTIKMPINYERSGQAKHDEITLLCDAASYFNKFKLLFAGLCLSSSDRQISRGYFMGIECSTAFRLIEYELSFLHDLMHTKVTILQSTLGYACRFTCLCALLVAFIMFFTVDHKRRLYDYYDISFTHALFIGSIVFEIISLVKLIFSEWSIIRRPWLSYIIPECILKRKRWSRSVFQYNMFSYCLYKHSTSFIGYVYDSLGFFRKMRVMWFSSLVAVTEDLEEFIFNELKMKSESANDLEDAKEACSRRRLSAESALLWPLNSTSCSGSPPPSYELLKWSIEDYDYMESLLLWHIATDLCYNNLDKKSAGRAEGNNEIKFCKLLSDYMFYLIVMQPTLLSPYPGNWSIVFQDTQAEARMFFAKHSIVHHMEACEKLFSVEIPYRPAATVKGDASKSLLFDACFLAKKLKDMEADQQWDIMSRVWMELMSFAAISCSPTLHAQQPSKGGELLTFTWLLMNHLGLGTQFSKDEKPRG